MSFNYIDFIPILVPDGDDDNIDHENLLTLSYKYRKKILKWYKKWYSTDFEVYILPWNVFRVRCLSSNNNIDPKSVCNPDKYSTNPLFIGQKKYHIRCYKCSCDKPLPCPRKKCLLFHTIMWIICW